MSGDTPVELTADEIAQQLASKLGVTWSQISVIATPDGGWDASLIVAIPSASAEKENLAQIVRALQPHFRLKT